MNNIDTLLKEAKKIHFIGIGGSGMCPVAEILLSLGYTVSGSDNNDTEENAEAVKEHQPTAKDKIQEMIDRLNNQEFTRFWP